MCLILVSALFAVGIIHFTFFKDIVMPMEIGIVVDFSLKCRQMSFYLFLIYFTRAQSVLRPQFEPMIIYGNWRIEKVIYRFDLCTETDTWIADFRDFHIAKTCCMHIHCSSHCH